MTSNLIKIKESDVSWVFVAESLSIRILTLIELFVNIRYILISNEVILRVNNEQKMGNLIVLCYQFHEVSVR